MISLPKKDFNYKGAWALIELHKKHILSFVNTWKKANTSNIKLPETDDEWYVSMNMLLRHILNSARGYIMWIHKNLDLPDPEIDCVPEALELQFKYQSYLDHLLAKWGTGLIDVPMEKFFMEVFTSNWGTDYCIEAMLEHAVMHPVRHEYQLITLMSEQNIF